MLSNVLGKKVGMTQVFDSKGVVVPVTVVDVGSWFVTQTKTVEKDGYSALQIACLRDRYVGEEFSPVWLEKKAEYFLHVKEISFPENDSFQLGQRLTIEDIALAEGDKVIATGISKGLGFQGVVKRWGFAGGPKSHGSKFHRRPGSSGHLRRQGEVIKGKKSAGHMGVERITIKGLKVVRVDKDNGCLFIKGALPGKKDTLITICKQGK